MTSDIALTALARAGFQELSQGRDSCQELAERLGWPVTRVLEEISQAPDPDGAIRLVLGLLDREESVRNRLSSEDGLLSVLARVLGSSLALGEFLLRHPSAFAHVTTSPVSLPTPEEMVAGFARVLDENLALGTFDVDVARDGIRVHYRELLLQVALYDVMTDDPQHVVKRVGEYLADIAGAVIDSSLNLAREQLATTPDIKEQLKLVELAVIGMGKCGAHELNYISDVDVIFVGRSGDSNVLSNELMLAHATKLAQLTMRGVFETSREPALWEVDANLRPEGKSGALVRTLESHIAYYERWAKNWEFQALLKARPIAGDLILGEEYCAAIAPFVWSSASRSEFVDQVQRMRERVTEHIPVNELDWQIKLGPGGLRDIEFTVQLLQLVHGASDTSLRVRGTLEATQALVDGGYIGRDDGSSFMNHYRLLRVLEHRIQMRQMKRTHLMPANSDEQRILARASAVAPTGDEMLATWSSVKLDVRALHQKIFYRPLLGAVARLNEEGLSLTNEQAQDRLAAIGFVDPKSALTHIGALTNGLARRATIQRTLLPVLLQWFSEGADPDYGLLAFRRLSESLGESHWYLRMLRDGQAARRLAFILSGSRFSTDLLERYPEAVAWLDNDDDLQPRQLESLESELQSVMDRHGEANDAVAAVRTVRRRETLRLAMGALVDVLPMGVVQRGLSDITDATLAAFLHLAQRDVSTVEFCIVAMGRLGGRELGFGSDADVMFVYRNGEAESDSQAQADAERIVTKLREYCDDPRFALELDLDLRPEGKKGLVVRSLSSYASYYERWSEVWEAQALLRARVIAGEFSLGDEFTHLIDSVRYRSDAGLDEAREIRRIKARVESERLPQGTPATRHLKLGRGSLSDVEWTIQLLQLLHGSSHQELRTPSTIDALSAAVDADLLTKEDASKLNDAWLLASRLRSALVLWGASNSDVLPTDIDSLDGIARILGMGAGNAAEIEEQWLSTSRKARSVVERVFFGSLDEV